jgi:hypothetical protein
MTEDYPPPADEDGVRTGMVWGVLIVVGAVIALAGVIELAVILVHTLVRTFTGGAL